MPVSDHKTDADLLKEFSGSGSHAAFTALVERHGPMVHAVSMRVLSNHHDAEDVTQAAFLALAREAAKLGRQPSVAGWLHTVSRRLSLDVRKSRESRQRREQAAMNESSNSTPDATLSAGFRRELDAALDRLPDRYRQPLVLFHLEGASLDEVARRLDLQPSTLRTRLSRARDMLRQILCRQGVEVTSVGALGALFTAEAKAATFTSTLLSTVLNAGTGGAAVSPGILQLAGKAAGAKSIALPSTFTTLTILMKTKATLISATVLALAAIGTTVHFVNESGRGNGKESRAAEMGNLSRPGAGEPTGHGERKARPRQPKFQSIEEAEQALLAFDMGFLSERDREKLERGLYRYRSLVERIPEAYYSELASRMGEGADKNLESYIRQMALYQEWGRVDFDAALADLSNIENAPQHSKALQNVFSGTMDADPQAAMKKAETLEIQAPEGFGDFERVDLMDTIFDHWIESDPFSALEWAKQAQVPDKRRDQWIDDGLRAWGEQDPKGAERWRERENFEGFKP